MKRIRAKSREGMKVTTWAAPASLHRRLAVAAVEESTVMSEIVRQAVKEWLDRRNRKRRTKGGKR
jgi:hypothetical protein